MSPASLSLPPSQTKSYDHAKRDRQLARTRALRGLDDDAEAHGHLPEVQARLKDPEPELVGFEDKEADPDGFATYLAWAYRWPKLARDQFKRGYPRPHELAEDKSGKLYSPYVEKTSKGEPAPSKHKRSKRTRPSKGAKGPGKQPEGTTYSEPDPDGEPAFPPFPPGKDPNDSDFDDDDGDNPPSDDSTSGDSSDSDDSTSSTSSSGSGSATKS